MVTTLKEKFDRLADRMCFAYSVAGRLTFSTGCDELVAIRQQLNDRYSNIRCFFAWAGLTSNRVNGPISSKCVQITLRNIEHATLRKLSWIDGAATMPAHGAVRVRSQGRC